MQEKKKTKLKLNCHFC